MRSNGSRRCRGPLARRPVIRCFSIRNPKLALPPFPAAGGHSAFLIRHWHWLGEPPFATAPAPLRSRLGNYLCPIPHSLFPVPCRFVRTLTKSGPPLDFVRTLTTFRSSAALPSGLPLWHGDLHQFCPLKNPSKTEQNGTKTEQNGHINRKNRSKTSAFCLTYLNIRGPNRPSRPRIKDRRQKKRAFARFGERKIDVSLMQQDAC